MKASICVDMNGCPNRCRHWWLGHGTNKRLDIDDFLWVCRQFSGFCRDGRPYLEEMKYETWFREPDYGENYRDLWELEVTLNKSARRHELVSVWRLVRDASYGPWLKEIGLETAQLTFFGTEKNTDFFSGRKEAYHDLLKAIDVLLENRIAPRIQLFPFRTTVDDFSGLERIFIERKLEDRTRELGEEFIVFVNTPTPLGRGYDLEDVLLTHHGLLRLPVRFLESTLRHYKVDDLGKVFRTEGDWLDAMVDDDRPMADVPKSIYFMVTPTFDVYPNEGELAPWWYLGNLKRDGVQYVVDGFEKRKPPGLSLNREMPVSKLARKYGRNQQEVLWSRTDLVHRWIRLEAMNSIS